MPCSDSPSSLERGEAQRSREEQSKDDTGRSDEEIPTDPAAAIGGIPGLAFLMVEDNQYNIHPSYETSAVEILLHSSTSINRKLRRLRRIQRRKTKLPHAKKTGTTKREKVVIDQLRSELTAYYDLLIKLSTVVRYHEPEDSSVEGVRNWTKGNFPAWHQSMKGNPTEEFRSLWPERGKMDRFIVNMPKSKFGRMLFKPFETKKQDAGDVELRTYNHVAILRISMAICFCAWTVFFQVPVAVLSYRILDRGIAIGMALGFCFLFTLFCQWLIPHRPEALCVLVFAYGAIISGSIVNSDNN